jgi:hypothetical protein
VLVELSELLLNLFQIGIISIQGCKMEQKPNYYLLRCIGKGLLSILLCLSPYFVIAADSLPKGSLSGRIVDPDGKPVGSARVWINTSGNKILAEAQSDAEGHFRLNDMKPIYRHDYPILIEADGFARQYIPSCSYSVFAGMDFDLGEIRVDRGRVYYGQVLDVDGKSPSDAEATCRVCVCYLGHTVYTIGPDYHLALDSEGRFRTPPVLVGYANISVVAPERRLAWQELLVQPGGEETLDPIRLERDVPIQGTVQDEQGRPIADSAINASGHKTNSDSDGRFTLHGFGPNPHFQLQLRKEGYVFINRSITIRDDGIYWSDVRDHASTGRNPTKQLDIVVQQQPVAWIEGKATDAETGKPVQLDKVVICFFERKANGDIVFNGCRSPNFEQPEVGKFRVPYSSPDEYHLTFSAADYFDGEAFTPKVTELKKIEGIEVKLKKKGEDTNAVIPKQTISGTISRNGKPVNMGWVGLWLRQGETDVVNAYILRGRTVVGDPIYCANAPIQEGKYRLDVLHPNDAWFVVVEEPGQPITQIGPLKIELNENKQLDISCTAGGSISGRVKNVPPGWEGCLRVVAFNKMTGLRKEIRVGADGGFCIKLLPPGEYGLKVGHDAYKDSEVPRAKEHKDIPREAWDTKSDPWKRATVVNVQADREISGIELDLPSE